MDKLFLGLLIITAVAAVNVRVNPTAATVEVGKNGRRKGANKLSVKQGKKVTDTEITLGNSETTEAPTCPKSFVSLNGGCYRFNLDETNCVAAQEICRSLDPRASLLSLETKEETETINNYLTQNKLDKQGWCMSASDEENEGIWKWKDSNRPFEFTDWCRGEPNNARGGREHCVMIAGAADGWNVEKRLCWADIQCDNEEGFKPYSICEIKT